MTLLMALRYKEGYVVAADSQTTDIGADYIDNGFRKVKVHDNIVIGLQGDERFYDPVYRELKETINSDGLGETQIEIIDNAEKKVAGVSTKIAKRFEKTKSDNAKPTGSIIIAGKTENKDENAFAYTINTEGTSIHAKQKSVRGSSFKYATTILRQRYGNPMDISRPLAEELAYYVIKRCCRIDTKVSEPINIVNIPDNGNIRRIDEERGEYPIEKKYSDKKDSLNVIDKIPTRKAKQLTDSVNEHGINTIVKQLEGLNEYKQRLEFFREMAEEDSEIKEMLIAYFAKSHNYRTAEDRMNLLLEFSEAFSGEDWKKIAEETASNRQIYEAYDCKDELPEHLREHKSEIPKETLEELSERDFM